MTLLTMLGIGPAKKQPTKEAMLQIGSQGGKAMATTNGPVKKFSSVGFSLVGGGALDCVEGIGQCPKPECLAPGRKWGPCRPIGCEKAEIGFPLCRVTNQGQCTKCSA
eukprot:PhF_6_TR29856/c0_g1_i3/m.43810